MKKNVILIFDIGKTNKKYSLFDEGYNELESGLVQFPETTDDDKFPCDDLASIKSWILGVFERFKADERYQILFVNFSTYGATLVHLDKKGEPCTPLYNYLKEIPDKIKDLFIFKHGDIHDWSKRTATPYLGMLNAGQQLFWLKYQKPDLFRKIHTTVFLPQYLSYILTKILSTEYTVIGCHTGMWDYEKNDFHEWMYKEELNALLPSVRPSHTIYDIPGTDIQSAIGIHDSSAALIPYLQSNQEPFMLLSTGTWSICLNPFNDDPLTGEELEADCLCYLQPEGKQVKASRFFLGDIFSKWQRILAGVFSKPEGYYKSVEYDHSLYENSKHIMSNIFNVGNPGERRSLSGLRLFDSYEEAYHQLICELVNVQVNKIKLVVGRKNISRIYVDGGFAKNAVFLNILQEMLPGFVITASDVANGSSLGAAMIGQSNKAAERA